MNQFAEHLNELLVETFRNILKVEEQMLRNSESLNLSISEMHLIESVGKLKEEGRTISSIAEDLGVTLPSVTVAINKLKDKGYVEKVRGSKDSRTVIVKLTRSGRKVDAAHRYFHENMVRRVTNELSEEERQALEKGIVKLNAFFKAKAKPEEE